MLTRSFVFVFLAVIGLVPAGCKKDDAKPGTGPDDAAPAAAPVHDAQAQAEAPADAAAAAVDTDAGSGTNSEPDAGARGATGDDTGGSAAGDDDKLTNIRVLPKSWSKAKVNAYMKNEVSKGLGVKCDFCHVKGDFAADDNEHKALARQMITLTQNTNKKFFKGKAEVTCVTCHHGKEHPPE